MTRTLRRTAGRVAAAAVLAAGTVVVASAPAHAAWSTLSSYDGSVLLACKSPEEGGYGPVWRITIVHALRAGHDWGFGQHDVTRSGQLVSSTGTAPSGSGAWDVRVTYASRLFPDRLVGYGNFGGAAGGGGRLYDRSAAGLGNC